MVERPPVADRHQGDSGRKCFETGLLLRFAELLPPWLLLVTFEDHADKGARLLVGHGGLHADVRVSLFFYRVWLDDTCPGLGRVLGDIAEPGQAAMTLGGLFLLRQADWVRS